MLCEVNDTHTGAGGTPRDALRPLNGGFDQRARPVDGSCPEGTVVNAPVGYAAEGYPCPSFQTTSGGSGGAVQWRAEDFAQAWRNPRASIHTSASPRPSGAVQSSPGSPFGPQQALHAPPWCAQYAAYGGYGGGTAYKTAQSSAVLASELSPPCFLVRSTQVQQQQQYLVCPATPSAYAAAAHFFGGGCSANATGSMSPAGHYGSSWLQPGVSLPPILAPPSRAPAHTPNKASPLPERTPTQQQDCVPLPRFYSSFSPVAATPLRPLATPLRRLLEAGMTPLVGLPANKNKFLTRKRKPWWFNWSVTSRARTQSSTALFHSATSTYRARRPYSTSAQQTMAWRPTCPLALVGGRCKLTLGLKAPRLQTLTVIRITVLST